MQCLNNPYKNQLLLWALIGVACLACSSAESQTSKEFSAANPKMDASQTKVIDNAKAQPAAENFLAYLPFLKDKKIGLVVNHTSMVGTQHLVDFLLDKQTLISKIFTPEHGFKGTADAGRCR